ncbi:MAG: HAD family phosphatase [Clostridia bacterium]|nr:HAD family phosphatase [Clostridia bacterium]
MKIKLMAFDLDNTLFNKEGKLEESTKAILHKCMDSGVVVTIATGRMFPSAKKIADEIETDAPIICYNGACLRGRNDEKPLMLQPVAADVQKEIAQICKDRGLFLQMYANDEIYVTEHNHYSQSDPDSKNAPVNEIGDFTKIDLMPTPKMMIYNTSEFITKLEAEMEEKYNGRAYFAQSASTLLEIMDCSVNKGFALKNLADALGIKQEEVAAFGDNSNDFEMVVWAGMGVSVSNAVESLKFVSQYIAKNERNKGVEEAINYFFENDMI